MKKYILIIIAILSLCAHSIAQTNTGYQPHSIKNNLNLTGIQTYTLPAINIGEVEAQDKAEESTNLPPRFAIENEVNITTDNSGNWQLLPNGDRIWLLAISGPEAKSLSFYYDKFNIPDGGLFSIYDVSRSQILGAFTSSNNRGTASKPGDFITGLIFNEEAILEYYQPASVKGSPIISISKAMYGYRGPTVQLVNSRLKSAGFGGSASCEVNVDCPPTGTDWQSEKRGIALILLNSSTRLATGSLINNVRGDGKPYFLTANHILFQPGGPGTTSWDAISNPYMTNWLFYWNYEYTGANPCTSNGTDFIPPYTTGATVEANADLSVSDFALLLLTQSPYDLSPPVNAFFNGWERNTSACTTITGATCGPTSGTIIHHPFGDIKKITTADVSASTGSPIFASSSASFGIGFWSMVGGLGTIGIGSLEHGSSGSPLFDQNHHIVGQLSQGSGLACDNTTHLTGFFGRFDVSWNNGTVPTGRLMDWLDPDGTNTTSIDGGTLQPCPVTSLTVTSPITASVTDQSGGSLIASSAISSGITVDYYATSYIDLTDGFSSGTDFTAMIAPCLLVSPKTNNPNNIISTNPLKNNLPQSDLFTEYPNPLAVNFSIILSLTEAQTGSLSLYDLEGRVIMRFWSGRTIDAGNLEEPLVLDENIADGSYILRFSGSSYISSVRIVKSSH